MLKLLIMLVFCLPPLLTGCTTEHQTHFQSGKINVAHSEAQQYPRMKNSHTITFYAQDSTIKRPYRIIGKKIVPRYNWIGLKRGDTVLAEHMKKIAASMGGDAVIHIKKDDNKIEGTVIAYEMVML